MLTIRSSSAVLVNTLGSMLPKFIGRNTSLGSPVVMIDLPGLTLKRKPLGILLPSIPIIGWTVSASPSIRARILASSAFCEL